MYSGERPRYSSLPNRLISFFVLYNKKAPDGYFSLGPFFCYARAMGLGLSVGPPGSFLRRKGGRDFLGAVGPAAHPTRPERPRPMPHRYGPRPGCLPVMGALLCRPQIRSPVGHEGPGGPVPGNGQASVLYPTTRSPCCCAKQIALTTGHRAWGLGTKKCGRRSKKPSLAPPPFSL